MADDASVNNQVELELNGQQVQQAYDELSFVGQLLAGAGYNITADSSYQDVQAEMGTALQDAQAFIAEMDIQPPMRPPSAEEMLANYLMQANGIEPSPENGQEIQTSIQDFDSNIDIMVSYTQAVNEAQANFQDVVFLGEALGVDGPEDGESYTADYAQNVKEALDSHLENYRVVVAGGSLDGRPGPVKPDDPAAAYADRLKEQMASDLGITPEQASDRLQGTMNNMADRVEAFTQVVENSGQETAPDSQAPDAGQSDQSQDSAGQQTEVQYRPDRELSPDVIEANKFLQETCQEWIDNIDQNSGVLALAGIEAPDLPNMPRQDGQWDEDSLNALQECVGFVKERMGLSEKYPGDEITPALIQDIQNELDTVDGMSRTFLDAVTGGQQVENQFMQTALDLIERDELRPVEQVPVEEPVRDADAAAERQVGATDTTAEQNADADQAALDNSTDESADADDANQNVTDSVSQDIQTVEAVLVGLGAKLPEYTDQIKDMAGQFGMSDQVDALIEKATLDGSALQDNGFGAESQEALAHTLMALKLIDGQTTADGSYSQEIGDNLQLSILTKAEFAFVRDALDIRQYSPDEAQALMQDELNLPSYETFQGQTQNATQESYNAYIEQLRAQHEERAGDFQKLNTFFDSLDTLSENNLIDPEQKAKETNLMNMGMVAMRGFLEDMGMLGGLQDFFQNNAIGQLIGSVLGMMGINVEMLWDEEATSDVPPMDQAVQNAENALGTMIEKVQSENPDMAFADVMMEVKEEFTDNSESFVAKMGLSALIGSENGAALRASIQEGLDQAAQQPNAEAAQQAFGDHLEMFASQYNAGQDVEYNGATYPTNPDVTHDSRTQDVRDLAEQNPDAAAEARQAAEAAASQGTSGASVNADDAAIVVNDDQAVKLTVTPDTGTYEQEPMRFSDGRIAEIQTVLYENWDALGLNAADSADLFKEGEVGNKDAFTDTMTPGTAAALEELYARAKIYDMVQNDVEVTQERLDAVKSNPMTGSSEDMAILSQYLNDKLGAESPDPVLMTSRIESLDTDMQSMANDSEAADVSVWQQSLAGVWGQINYDILALEAQPRPAEPEDDGLSELYEQYWNYQDAQGKDIPCDVPKFFTQEGSDSVYALVRIKGDGEGDMTPKDDEYKILELEDYKKTLELKPEDQSDIQVLLDNYNWTIENPALNATEAEKQQSILEYINKKLCLEGPDQAPKPEAEAAQEAPDTKPDDRLSPTTIAGGSSGHHAVPDAYRDLREVTSHQADFLADKLGLSEENGRHGLDALATEIMAGSHNNPYLIMDLKELGLEHSEMDAVVAYNGTGGVEYRYVNYEEDHIKPLAEHAGNGPVKSDIAARSDEVTNDPRRLDDFLDQLEAGGDRLSIGYDQMRALHRNDSGVLETSRAIDVIYGDGEDLAWEHDRAYHDAYQERWNVRGSAEQLEQDRQSLKNRPELENGQNVTVAQQHRAETSSQNDFNNACGDPSWWDKLWGADEECSASAQIEENSRDMGAESVDEAPESSVDPALVGSQVGTNVGANRPTR